MKGFGFPADASAEFYIWHAIVPTWRRDWHGEDEDEDGISRSAGQTARAHGVDGGKVPSAPQTDGFEILHPMMSGISARRVPALFVAARECGLRVELGLEPLAWSQLPLSEQPYGKEHTGERAKANGDPLDNVGGR